MFNDMEDVLGSLGMNDAFERIMADFPGMSSGRELFLSKVMHTYLCGVWEPLADLSHQLNIFSAATEAGEAPTTAAALASRSGKGHPAMHTERRTTKTDRQGRSWFRLTQQSSQGLNSRSYMESSSIRQETSTEERSHAYIAVVNNLFSYQCGPDGSRKLQFLKSCRWCFIKEKEQTQIHRTYQLNSCTGGVPLGGLQEWGRNPQSNAVCSSYLPLLLIRAPLSDSLWFGLGWTQGHCFTRIQGPTASPGPGAQAHPDPGARGLARTRGPGLTRIQGPAASPGPGAQGSPGSRGPRPRPDPGPRARPDPGPRAHPAPGARASPGPGAQGSPGSRGPRPRPDPGPRAHPAPGARGLARTRGPGLTRLQGPAASPGPGAQGSPGSRGPRPRPDPGPRAHPAPGARGLARTRGPGLTRLQGPAASPGPGAQGSPGSRGARPRPDPGFSLTRTQGRTASPRPRIQPHPDPGAHGLARTQGHVASPGPGAQPHPDPVPSLTQTQGHAASPGSRTQRGFVFLILFPVGQFHLSNSFGHFLRAPGQPPQNSLGGGLGEAPVCPVRGSGLVRGGCVGPWVCSGGQSPSVRTWPLPGR
ncbi:hypothetical protein QTO34_013790 [Cnephaeus nilssonii]|uniref:Uncharacterized protein n=1 Tax=Cnephaeus nilssonii TaxID=3371016 RepID=A0AA40I8P4_CNENI|nr:hypothetical protein QTO34_013790 [Eptesicus nilssonii]